MRIDIRKLGRSFKVAFSGLDYAIRNENTFRTGTIIALGILFFTFYFPLSSVERAVIFLTVFTVLGMELMNTQVERTTNLIDRNNNPQIRVIKDLAAAAVLMIALVAVVVAVLIFIPYILGLK